MDQNRSLRVLIADPHAVVCEGVAEVLACQPDLEIVGKSHTGRKTIELFASLRPDVLLTERDFPDMDGVVVISTLVRQFRSACILVYSLQEGDEAIHSAIEAGAKGYCFKNASAAAIAQAIRTVCSGKMALVGQVMENLARRPATSILTRREREVLGHLSKGMSNQEIAAALFVTEGTVKSHINRILGKLKVNDRTQAVLVALRRGMVKLT